MNHRCHVCETLSLLVTAVVLLWHCAGLVRADQCLRDSCSNDPDGVLGDETICWDASPGATRYEIALDGTDEICATVIDSGDRVCYLISGTPCDEVNDGSGFRVRACDDTGCSAWSEEIVEILPYACLNAKDWNPCHDVDRDGTCHGGHDTQCEHPCYDWQPGTDWHRLAERYEECP